MRRHTVTSVDIARRAGVSQATVSVVLNGARSNIRVSEATRQRVIAAAAELGYAPHHAAQALRRQRSGTIGYVPRLYRKTPYERPIPYLLGIHIAQSAMLHGYHVIEVSAESSDSRASGALVPFLLNRRVDGVILDAPETAGELAPFIEREVPVIQLMRPQAVAGTATITVDASPGITAAIDHLVALGHRDIAFLGSSNANPVDRARLDAFRAALARHGITVDDAAIRLGAAYQEAGYAFTQALLALPWRPTALFVASDSMALGALRALYEARVRVPDAMSIISYDDAFASSLYPPLTSVAQPVQEIAERAVALLVERLDGADGFPEEAGQIIMRTHLVIRDSTGRAADTRDRGSLLAGRGVEE